MRAFNWAVDLTCGFMTFVLVASLAEWVGVPSPLSDDCALVLAAGWVYMFRQVRKEDDVPERQEAR